MTTDRRGFVLDGGTVVELPLPRQSNLHYLRDLNGNGLIVGTVRKKEGPDTNYVPLLWTVSASTAAVQELPRGEHTNANAMSLNGLNEVAGHANPWEALLWKPAATDSDCNPHPRTGECR